MQTFIILFGLEIEARRALAHTCIHGLLCEFDEQLRNTFEYFRSIALSSVKHDIWKVIFSSLSLRRMRIDVYSNAIQSKRTLKSVNAHTHRLHVSVCAYVVKVMDGDVEAIEIRWTLHEGRTTQKKIREKISSNKCASHRLSVIYFQTLLLRLLLVVCVACVRREPIKYSMNRLNVISTFTNIFFVRICLHICVFY